MNILIIFKRRDDIISYLKELVRKLKDKNFNIYLDREYEFLPRELYDVTSTKDYKGLVLVLGGDGTILKAAKLVGNDALILGVNFGLRGFLTEISPNELWKGIDLYLKGNYKVDERFKLEILFRDKRYEGLNEVAIITSRPAKLLKFRIYVDDTFIDEVQADGLIVATPTGSTAYSLSAGGPIIDPRADVFVLNYICPFRLSIRPIVIPSNVKIRIEYVKENEVEYSYLTIDGEIKDKIYRNECITVYKSKNVVKFVRFKDNYYKKVRELLI